MIGTAFSPYYALGRRLGRGRALDHVTMNVALYARDKKRWCMTEGAGAKRSSDRLAIGNSALSWHGDKLVADINERSAPFGGGVQGRVTLHPQIIHGAPYALDDQGSHLWWPIAPLARAEVVLQEPALRFSGHAYLDANAGDAPLEQDFSSWDWCRTPSQRGACVVYDVHRRDGSRRVVNIAFDESGRVTQRPALISHPLPKTKWGLSRRVLGQRTGTPRVLRTLEDTPFYSRSQLLMDVEGRPEVGVHEGLDLDRFRAAWVQCLLPFKMRRRR